MYKKSIILTVMVICIAIVGCKKYAREAFLAEQIEVTDEIVRLVDANPNNSGVNQAWKYYNSKRDILGEKFEKGLEASRGFSLRSSGDFPEAMAKNRKKLEALIEKNEKHFEEGVKSMKHFNEYDGGLYSLKSLVDSFSSMRWYTQY